MTMVHLELKLLGSACTDSALGFENPEGEQWEPVWLPRSQVDNLDDILERQLEDGIRYVTEEMVEVHIPEWLAEKKGLDGYAEEDEDDVDLD